MRASTPQRKALWIRLVLHPDLLTHPSVRKRHDVHECFTRLGHGGCRSFGSRAQGRTNEGETFGRGASVHPTGHHSKICPQVDGRVLRFSGRHAKIRREGYRKR